MTKHFTNGSLFFCQIQPIHKIVYYICLVNKRHKSPRTHAHTRAHTHLPIEMCTRVSILLHTKVDMPNSVICLNQTHVCEWLVGLRTNTKKIHVGAFTVGVLLLGV
jgi:hypothetical protein